MIGFISSLVTRIMSPDELQGGRQLYVLTQDFYYKSDLLGDICVPAGFITDFASIPRFAYSYIDPEDPCIIFPSVVHDYLYRLGGALPNSRTYARSDADRVLREAMTVSGARNDQL